MVGRASLILALALAVTGGCGGSHSALPRRPCVIPEAEMASIWQVHQMKASPQKNGYECLYAAENGVVVDLSIRTPKQFGAERARFEDQGILLPPLRPVSGAGPGATVDPRYNSLNVPAEGLVVSVQLVGPQPSDPAEQLAQEKRIARSAVGWLHPRSA